MGVDLAFALHYNKEVLFLRNTDTVVNNTTLPCVADTVSKEVYRTNLDVLKIFCGYDTRGAYCFLETIGRQRICVTNPLAAHLPIRSCAVDGFCCSYRNSL